MSQYSRFHSISHLSEGAKIYLIGIGGISMSGLAEIAQAAGFQIFGSDMHATTRTQFLKRKGMDIAYGHDAARIERIKPDLVVFTAAVHEDNPEIMQARAMGLTTIDRATFLGWLNQTFDQIINISGTHGKTTTTALCSLILMASGINPTVHLGAELEQFRSTVHIGEPGRLMVSEACEYMNSFLKFHTTTAAILNIDYDHVDFYDSLDDVILSFVQFAAQVPDNGYLVIPDFDPQVKDMLNQLNALRKSQGRSTPEIVWFGAYPNKQMEDQKEQQNQHNSFNRQSNRMEQHGFYYRNLQYVQGLPYFEVWHNQTHYCTIKLRIPGLHNVYNTLAAIACAHLNGATPDAVVAVSESFRGAEGRFTETGTYRGARVIADYAHHPAAAKATLEAARHIPHERTWVVFQPLTFTRTRVLFDDFVQALKDCDSVIFSEIYSDRDTAGPDHMSSQLLVERINKLGGHARFAKDFTEIKQMLDAVVKPGDLILVLGPEDIRQFADQLTGRQAHEKLLS